MTILARPGLPRSVPPPRTRPAARQTARTTARPRPLDPRPPRAPADRLDPQTELRRTARRLATATATASRNNQHLDRPPPERLGRPAPGRVCRSVQSVTSCHCAPPPAPGGMSLRNQVGVSLHLSPLAREEHKVHELLVWRKAQTGMLQRRRHRHAHTGSIRGPPREPPCHRDLFGWPVPTGSGLWCSRRHTEPTGQLGRSEEHGSQMREVRENRQRYST